MTTRAELRRWAAEAPPGTTVHAARELRADIADVQRRLGNLRKFVGPAGARSRVEQISPGAALGP